jgi:hypothetical protein
MVAEIGMQRRQHRVARTRATITAARWEIGGWLAARRTEGSLRHLTDHFEILGTVLVRMLDGLDGELDVIPGSAPSGEVYDVCRSVEGGVATVVATFSAFARRYDQRLDSDRFGPRTAGQPGQADVLAAADELARSCWTAPFAELGTRPPSLPLVYLEPNYDAYHGGLDGAGPDRGDEPGPDGGPVGRHYAPAHRSAASWSAGRTEAGTSPAWAELTTVASPAELAAAFARELPIPMIAVPAWTVREAWWLATVARETGVLIRREFVPRGGAAGMDPAAGPLALDLTEAVATAAVGPREAPVSASLLADLADDWRRWRADAFADAYSVLMVGDAALWAATELEHTNADAVLTGSGPDGVGMPPVIRLALLDALVRLAAPGAAPAVGPIADSVVAARRWSRSPSAGQRVAAEMLERHLAVVPAVAEALLAVRLAGTPLSAVSGARPEWFATGGRVRSWSAALRRDPAVIPSGARRVRAAARQAIAAGVGAYLATVDGAALAGGDRRGAAPVPGRYGAGGTIGGRRSWSSARPMGAGAASPDGGSAAGLATLHNRLTALLITCGESSSATARTSGEATDDLAARLTAHLVRAVRERRSLAVTGVTSPGPGFGPGTGPTALARR